MSRVLVAVLGVVVVTSSVASTSELPQSDTERNGLTETEVTTLWSRDSDSGGTPMRSSTDSDLEPLANATDITFQRPPGTATTWTRNDFTDYTPGNETMSIAPTNTSVTDSWAIRDAHATIFALTPSTIAHVNDTTTRRYATPNGTLLAAIDYRVEPPVNESTENRTESWTVQDHEISDIRLETGRSMLARTNGTHTPRLSYRLAGSGQRRLTLTVEIEAKLEHTVTRRTSASNGTTANGSVIGQFETRVTVERDSVTVRDQIPVTVYAPTVSARGATFPNGTQALALSANQPWQGLVSADGATRVRTNWRYYTARETAWDELVRQTAADTHRFESPARPVVTHAYPSRRGPRTLPYDTGPAITDVWGPTHSRPNATIGRNVHIDVVRGVYTATRGLAVRAPGAFSDSVRARGIVSGTNPEIDRASEQRHVRSSRLTMSVADERNGTAVLRMELRDERTDAPIALRDGARQTTASVAGHNRSSGFIAVAGQRVETNQSGIALVRVQRPGVYPARYHPGSWLGHDPAYVGDTAVARWHPFTSVTGWFSFATKVSIGLLPLLAALYIGRTIGRWLRRRHSWRGEP